MYLQDGGWTQIAGVRLDRGAYPHFPLKWCRTSAASAAIVPHSPVVLLDSPPHDTLSSPRARRRKRAVGAGRRCDRARRRAAVGRRLPSQPTRPVPGHPRAHPLPQGRPARDRGPVAERLPRATPGSPACAWTCAAPAARRAWPQDEYTEAEQRDGCDVVAWMAEQPWCTGAVASWGVSYGGFSCIQVAALRPPALRAIAPVYATDDRYTDDMHFHGGALNASQPARLPDRDDRDERPAAAGRARTRVRPPLARADRADAGLDRRVDPAPARRPLLAQRLAAARLRAHPLPGADLRRLARRLPHGRAADGARTSSRRGSCWPGRGRTRCPTAASPGRATRSWPRWPGSSTAISARHGSGEPAAPRPRSVFFIGSPDSPLRPHAVVSGEWHRVRALAARACERDDARRWAGRRRRRRGVTTGVMTGQWCPPPPSTGQFLDQRRDDARSATFDCDAAGGAGASCSASRSCGSRLRHPGPRTLVSVKLQNVAPDGSSQPVTSAAVNIAVAGEADARAAADGDRLAVRGRATGSGSRSRRATGPT